MGHLRKTKTCRRVKRTKTDKRNNTQKQRRNRTFRKNRRISGGNGTGKRRAEEMHEYEQTLIEAEKDEENMKKQKQNMEKNNYLPPLGEGRGPVITVDQTEQLENSENQQRFNDEMAIADHKNGPPTFGGKKKRAIRQK
jgi:hypothetical protein